MKKLKIIIPIIVLVFLGFLTIFFLGEDVEKIPPIFFDDNSYIEGYIHSIEENSILVVEDLNNIDKNAIWFSITDETEIYSREEMIIFFNLQPLQKVKVWNIGPVLDSYPPKGSAVRIEVIEGCFIGGCSGEICSLEPNAISTCELLPGMECIKTAECLYLEGECKWHLSKESAQCFKEIREKIGEGVLETRIGHLFIKAKNYE